MSIGLKEIREARERIRGDVVETPCVSARAFDERFGGHAWFKFEILQRTGSFKERGALNRMLLLSPEERARGVVAASAGNHAQGVAFHARRLGIPATIVMPRNTPLIKVSNTRRFGAEVELEGSVYDEAMERALELVRTRGLTLIHPFDDPAVIAGQGTIGLELLEQCPEMDVVVVPVGGGGIASGIAAAVRSVRPEVRVVGVESSAMPAAWEAHRAGRVVEVEVRPTIADGIAVKRIGDNTFGMMEQWLTDRVLVSEEEIASAVLLLLEREKAVVEPACATSVAAVLNGHVPDVEGKNVVMLLSGGNIDVSRLSRIIDRGLSSDGRLAFLRVVVDDRPGAMARLTALIGERGANILQLHQRSSVAGLWVTEAEVDLTLETDGPEHVARLVAALRGQYGRVLVE